MSAAAIDPMVIQQAEIRASRMVGSFGFSNTDWDDLRQELLLDYLKRRPRFNPDRGDHRGFAFGVLQNRAAKLATRQCRIRSFAEPGTDADWSHLPTPDCALDLRLDVQAVVARLPVHLRILARQLSEMDVRDVLRHSGKSRSRVHQWIGELRAAFIEAGLGPPNIGGVR